MNTVKVNTVHLYHPHAPVRRGNEMSESRWISLCVLTCNNGTNLSVKTRWVIIMRGKFKALLYLQFVPIGYLQAWWPYVKTRTSNSGFYTECEICTLISNSSFVVKLYSLGCLFGAVRKPVLTLMSLFELPKDPEVLDLPWRMQKIVK